MYSFGRIWIMIWIYACVTVSSGSCVEVIPRTLLKKTEVVVGTWRTWLVRKRERGVVKDCKKEEIKASSEAICNVFVKKEGEVCCHHTH